MCIWCLLIMLIIVVCVCVVDRYKINATSNQISTCPDQQMSGKINWAAQHAVEG